MKQVRVKIRDKWYAVDIEEPIGSIARVTVEGEVFEVQVTQPESAFQSVSKSSRPTGLGHAKTTLSNGSGLITSPMSGKVLSIRVKAGDSVNSGDEMCVIEAMKMEQTIKAHRDGVVKNVFVRPLDQVTINATLVELE